MFGHLGVHFSLEERGVESLDEELFLHLDLILFLILVSSVLSNNLLSIHTNNSGLNSSLLVGSSGLENTKSGLSFSLVHLNLNHNLSQSEISLVSGLFGLSSLLNLLLEDFLFLL